MIERWDWQEPRHLARFKGQRFAALDPGKEGCLMICDDALGQLPVWYGQPRLIEVCTDRLVSLDVKVVIVETQYITNPKLARSVIELTFSMGILVGHACAAMPVDLFEVAPSSWQAEQKRRHSPEVPREKGAAAARMMLVARAELGRERDWRAASPAYQTGIAAAWGIAEWWRAL